MFVCRSALGSSAGLQNSRQDQIKARMKGWEKAVVLGWRKDRQVIKAKWSGRQKERQGLSPSRRTRVFRLGRRFFRLIRRRIRWDGWKTSRCIFFVKRTGSRAACDRRKIFGWVEGEKGCDRSGRFLCLDVSWFGDRAAAAGPPRSAAPQSHYELCGPELPPAATGRKRKKGQRRRSGGWCGGAARATTRSPFGGCLGRVTFHSLFKQGGRGCGRWR